ncbi:hypothetical protein BG011_007173 [Mortierella polycephala]|uniref:Uncharacterized protein n=1 Tax=Mortierella polycephala TaxID=41804 RepID=A0A9P6TZ07_9FUNG|nr:hypothetical protein BG011_007173 [Mortierella polycephala]
MNTFPATQQDAQQLPEQPHHEISCSNITTIPCLPSPSSSIHMSTVATSSPSTLSPATSTALPLQTVDPAFFSSANAPNIVNSPISSTERVEAARLAKNPNKKEGISINTNSSSENTSDSTDTPTALQFQNHTPTTNSPNSVVSASTTQSQASASLVRRSSSTNRQTKDEQEGKKGHMLRVTIGIFGLNSTSRELSAALSGDVIFQQIPFSKQVITGSARFPSPSPSPSPTKSVSGSRFTNTGQ